MAEKTANVVAMTTNFKKQMEEKEKQEAEKDAQIAALMQQMQLLANTTAELMLCLKGEKANMATGQHRKGESGAPRRTQQKCTICCHPTHKTEDCFHLPANADKRQAWMGINQHARVAHRMAKRE